MGKPLMIQLEDEVERRDRINQWKKAALLISKQSREVNRAFQKYSRLKHSLMP